ncbi:MAG TPA: hypothetical protein ENK71_01990, partial [Epsilonproteobacteria bacterium]|nr:hypothetical protein [Campylobacterota bacterium]
MKKPPGNFPTALLAAIANVMLIAWSMAALQAEDFTSKFTLSTTTPYLKEAVILKLDLIQTDQSKVILFKFS